MKRLLDLFRGSDEPTPAQIDKAIKQVTQPHGDPAVRMGAAERLKAWGTEPAIRALLRRFTIRTPSGAVDLEECQQVEEMLVSVGAGAVEPIVQYLARDTNVAFPARALERILPRDEFVSRVLGVLDRLEADFGSQPEQRAGLIRSLEEIDDPRVAAGVKRFLDDPDDDVAIAAMTCVARSNDASYRDALVEVLVRSGDRPRVREEAADRLAALGWPLEEQRRLVEPILPPGYTIDKKGRVLSAR